MWFRLMATGDASLHVTDRMNVPPRHRRLSPGLWAGALGLLMCGTAHAIGADVQWSGNGHWYRSVHAPNGTRWGLAQEAAIHAGGYLATCTSAAENGFVFDLARSPHLWSGFFGPCLGGYMEDAYVEPDRRWRWLTGEEWSFAAWLPGQPDNSGGAENRLHFCTVSTVPAAAWNDTKASSYFNGFVVEFDTHPPAEPPTRSTFEMGFEGWAACGDAARLVWASPGFLYVDDQPDGRSMGFLAPRQFLGDKRAMLGGTLSFDISPRDAVNLDPPAVILSSAEKTLTLKLPLPQVDKWNHQTAAFSEDAGWVVASSALPATRDDLTKVLSDITALVIVAEFYNGTERTYLDNVIMSSPLPQDLDHDADVDADDLVALTTCMSGPMVLLESTSDCRVADFDADGDVDQSDFGIAQRCYRGANRAVDPNCAN